MSFVIYNKATTGLVSRPTKFVRVFETYFTTERAAKMHFTKKNLSPVMYAIADAETFHATIEKKKTSINIMSGKSFEQPVNTPACCDPSSETYWAM